MFICFYVYMFMFYVYMFYVFKGFLFSVGNISFTIYKMVLFKKFIKEST